MEHQKKTAAIPLGYTITENKSPIGFVNKKPSSEKKDSLISDASEAHMLTVAPTGAGKGRSVIIPTLLTNPATMVVFDIKGEAWQVTHRRRKEMGHDVYVLDPFHQVTDKPDTLNPLDIIRHDPRGLEDNAVMLAEMIVGDKKGHKEPFWDDLTQSLISGLIAHLAISKGLEPEERTLGNLYDMLTNDDPIYNLAVLLDTQKEQIPDFSYREIASFLQHEGEKVRSSLRSTAQQHTRLFASQRMKEAVSTTTINLNDFIAGKPMTIYVVIPFAKLDSHKDIIRLWLTTFMHILANRPHRPETVTHFLVDEMARLGHMPQLEQAVTLLRSYGVRCMLFVQSLAQLKACYPLEHQTITDNCGLVSTFGLTRPHQARDMANLMGDISADTLLDMPETQCAVKINKQKTRMLQKLDYLHDPEYEGLYDENSFYTSAEDKPENIIYPFANSAENNSAPDVEGEADKGAKKDGDVNKD